MHCNNCNKYNKDDAERCSFCGEVFATQRCPYCNTFIGYEDEECPCCGAPVEHTWKEVEMNRSKREDRDSENPIWYAVGFLFPPIALILPQAWRCSRPTTVKHVRAGAGASLLFLFLAVMSTG